MKIIVFDTETTGLTPGNICQLAYLIIHNGEVMGKNLYFTVEYIEPSAEKVHGLSVEALKHLSGGMAFKDRIVEVKGDFDNADLLVAHNIQFDMGFLKAEFEGCGESFSYRKGFCTMRNFAPLCKLPARGNRGGPYKYPRLEELVEFFKITREDILKRAREYFGQDEGNFHDARYDTVATWLCYAKALEQGVIQESLWE